MKTFIWMHGIQIWCDQAKSVEAISIDSRYSQIKERLDS